MHSFSSFNCSTSSLYGVMVEIPSTLRFTVAARYFLMGKLTLCALHLISSVHFAISFRASEISSNLWYIHAIRRCLWLIQGVSKAKRSYNILQAPRTARAARIAQNIPQFNSHTAHLPLLRSQFSSSQPWKKPSGNGGNSKSGTFHTPMI